MGEFLHKARQGEERESAMMRAQSSSASLGGPDHTGQGRTEEGKRAQEGVTYGYCTTP